MEKNIFYKITNNKKAFFSALFILAIFLLNTNNLFINIQNLENPIEIPSSSSTDYVKPINVNFLRQIEYFNHSIYILSLNSNYSIFQLTFNDKYSDFSSVRNYTFKNMPNYLDIATYTTNSQKLFFSAYNFNGTQSLYEFNYQTKTDYFAFNKSINFSCQIPTQFQDPYITCKISSIKLIGNELYIIKTFTKTNSEGNIIIGSSLVDFNINTEKIGKEYVIPNSLYVNNYFSFRGESNGTLLIYYNYYKTARFLELNLNSGQFRNEIDISGTINNVYLMAYERRLVWSIPTFINNEIFILFQNELTGDLIKFMSISLQNNYQYYDLGINLLTYGLLALIIIFRKKINILLSKIIEFFTTISLS